MTNLAVVRIRGSTKLNTKIISTLDMLQLRHVNQCVIITDSPTYMGMLKKVKDRVTWGVVSKEALTSMMKKRGRVVGNKLLTDAYVKDNSKFKTVEELASALFDGKASVKDVKGMKPLFRLHPPRKGHAKAGIKKNFNNGGALGDRKEKINELLVKMI